MVLKISKQPMAWKYAGPAVLALSHLSSWEVDCGLARKAGHTVHHNIDSI